MMIGMREYALDWQTVQLGDIADFLDSQRRPIKEKDRVPGSYPYYGANGQLGTINGYLFNEPLVLLAEDGGHFEDPNRPIAYSIEGKTWVNNHAHVLRPKSNVDLDFLTYQLAFYDVLSFLTGSTRHKLTKSAASRLPIIVPPYIEQRRIADILKRADGIRRLRKQAQDIARQLIPSLFTEMFGDPATNPNGWPIGTIGDVITQAQYGTSKKAHENGAGLPAIRMGNVLTSGALDLEKLKYVELDEKDQAKYKLETGDILFNRTNSKDLVGKTGMWNGAFEAVAASYFIVVRADRSKILPAYLWAYMNTSYMKRRLFDTARGAIGQSNINARELKALPIPLPQPDLQEKFEVHLEGIHSVIRQQEAASSGAEHSFQSLLHRAFAG